MHAKFLFLLFLCVLCESSEIPSKYILVDGIEVLREDHEAFVKKEKVLKRKKTTIEDWFEKEIQLEESETTEYSKKFPKRCHGKNKLMFSSNISSKIDNENNL